MQLVLDTDSDEMSDWLQCECYPAGGVCTLIIFSSFHVLCVVLNIPNPFLLYTYLNISDVEKNVFRVFNE